MIDRVLVLTSQIVLLALAIVSLNITHSDVVWWLFGVYIVISLVPFVRDYWFKYRSANRYKKIRDGSAAKMPIKFK